MYQSKHFLAILLIASVSLYCTNELTTESEPDQQDLFSDDLQAVDASPEEMALEAAIANDYEYPSVLPPTKEEMDDEIEAQRTLSCDTCSPKPGNINKFKPALRLSDYEFTGQSDKAAISYCSRSKFRTCRGYMVLTSGGDASDRSELKMDNSMNMNKENIMRVQSILENVPSNGGTRGLTIAQLHNRASGTRRPPVRIAIENGKVVVVVAHSRTGSSSSYTRYQTVNFSDGDAIYIKLETTGSGDKVNYYIQNKRTGASKSKTFTLPSTWRNNTARSKMYFKAGAYQQQSSSGDAPRASFSRYELTLE